MDSQTIISLMLLNLAGGESVSDLDLLEKDRRVVQDAWRVRDLWYASQRARALEKNGESSVRRVPSESAVFRYLERFHDVDVEAGSSQGVHRRLPCKALEGLAQRRRSGLRASLRLPPRHSAWMPLGGEAQAEALYSYKKYGVER